MARPLIIGTTLIALAPVVLATPGEARTRNPCGIAGGRVIRTSPHAVIVRKRVDEGDVTRRYYACLRSTGRPVPVGSADGELDVDVLKFGFAGRFVAAVNIDCLAECAPEWVSLYDLRSGRKVSEIDRSDSYRYDYLDKVLVGTRGGVAIVEEQSTRRLRVWLDGGSPPKIVARGSRRQLRLRSMIVHGNLVRWRRGQQQHAFRMA